MGEVHFAYAFLGFTTGIGVTLLVEVLIEAVKAYKNHKI